MYFTCFTSTNVHALLVQRGAAAEITAVRRQQGGNAQVHSYSSSKVLGVHAKSLLLTPALLLLSTGSKAPTQKSILGVYTKSETGTFKMSATAYLCGTTYDKTKSGGLCPDTGSVVLTNKLPATAGEYAC
jgi:hypothetical protein